jgi:Holliday junction resolvase RusA-like endonuclease
MIKLTIPFPPIPWKAPFVGSRGAFSPRYKEMKLIKSIISEQYHGELIESAIKCEMRFYMPIPKSASKKKRARMIAGELRPIITPDIGNLEKLQCDCLQGIVIKNDSQIVDALSYKYYGEKPRTEIELCQI